jgi:hypothetical protein
MSDEVMVTVSGVGVSVVTVGVQGPQGPQGPAGGGGTTDHAQLSHLDYASAGHTGYAGTGVANVFTADQTFGGNVVGGNSGELHLKVPGLSQYFKLYNAAGTLTLTGVGGPCDVAAEVAFGGGGSGGWLADPNTGQWRATNPGYPLYAYVNPVHAADSSAANDTIYFSTTQNKLCYKDSSGTVNTLY